jgi:hypothetical protein
MKIPGRFKSILEKNQELDGIITYTASQFGKILEENKLFFSKTILIMELHI